MDKVKIIIRYEGKGDNITPVAFFPELTANYGMIVCYAHIGQHSEASLDYYRETKPCKGDEYDVQCLFNELKHIYDDCEFMPRQRIHHDDLTREAWVRAA